MVASDAASHALYAGETVWLREWHDALTAQLAFLTHMQAVAAELRTDPGIVFVSGMLRLCSLLNDALLDAASALSMRGAWIRAVLATAPPDAELRLPGRPALVYRWASACRGAAESVN